MQALLGLQLAPLQLRGLQRVQRQAADQMQEGALGELGSAALRCPHLAWSA
jgi:hypothetical protein